MRQEVDFAAVTWRIPRRVAPRREGLTGDEVQAPASVLIAATLLFATTRAHAEQPTPSEPAPPAEEEGAAGESRPGVINETAALPQRYGGYVTAAGGGGASGPVGEGAALFSFVSRFAVGAGGGLMTADEGRRGFSPWAGMFAQVLRQADVGLDLTASLRYRTVGPELTGSQVYGRLNAGRAFGPAYLAINGGVGQGLGLRSDVDYDAGSIFFVRVARIVRVGAEARVRGEAVDRLETAEDEGRPVEIVSGGVAGIEAKQVLVQALGGWSWPRGPLGSGPAALAAATFSF